MKGRDREYTESRLTDTLYQEIQRAIHNTAQSEDLVSIHGRYQMRGDKCIYGAPHLWH